MKKLFALALVVLGLAACQTDHSDLDVQFDGNATITLSIPADAVTRAGGSDSAKGGLENTTGETLRFILAVYDETGAEKIRETQYANENTLTANFPVRLVPGRKYTLVAWADMVDAVENAEEPYDSPYYNVTDLKEIKFKDNMWTVMDEKRDAFTASKTIASYSSSEDLNMQLTRPFAKVRVIATDVADLDRLGLRATHAKVAYTSEIPVSYNAFTQTAVDTDDVNHEYEIASYTNNDNDTTKVLYTDYIFANDEQGAVKFTLTTYEDAEYNKQIREVNFNTDIPVKRNMLTTLTGNVMTEGNNIEVTVDKEFGNAQNPGDAPYYNEIVEVGNAADLQEAINNSTEKTIIVLGGDIDLGALFGASTFSTRATAATLPIVISEDKKVNLDLNGCKITTPLQEGSTTNHEYAFENRGSLTIQDSKGTGQIIARGIFNYGTMTLKSGTINACDGNGGYGVINYEGAEFIMNGGSIVTSYEDGDTPGNGIDASPLRVDVGATATINGGTINNVSNFTCAIDNYGETTINGGTFETIHTTIMNHSTMTIYGGSFTCNGLEGITAHTLWAAEGTTTINGGTFDGKDNYNGFNVDASEGAVVNINGGKFLPVHSGSLYGKGTINVMGGEFFDDPSERLVAGYGVTEQENGYYVVENNGYYTDANGIYYITDVKGLQWLAEQTNGGNAFQGKTIKLVNDIDLNNVEWTPIGTKTNQFKGNLDGQNNTIKNLYIESEDNYQGLFGYATGGTISNLIIENANVKGKSYVAAVTGCGFLTSHSNITVTGDVKIEGSGQDIAVITGYTYANTTTININVNEGSYVKGKSYFGSVVGYPGEGNTKFENIQSNIDVIGKEYMIGGITGIAMYGNKFIDCHYTGNVYLMEGDATSNNRWMRIGGIAGSWMDGDESYVVTLENCSFTGELFSQKTDGTTATKFDFDGYVGRSYNATNVGKLIINGKTYTKVASIGDTSYLSLEEAIATAQNGDTIVLCSNVTLTETATIAEGKSVTLDLNGKTLSHADEENSYVINNLGNLTITGNGTVNARGIYNGYSLEGGIATAELTIENGTFNAKGTNGGAAVFNYGIADIKGGSFTSIGGYSLNNQVNASMTIADGVVANNGVYATGATVVFNGGEISGNRSGCHVIYGWNANITINGGTFYNNNSGNSTVMAAGTTVITYNNGTFGIKDGRVPGNDNTWTSCLLDSANSATVVINNGRYNGGFRVQSGTSMTINGGLFNDCYGSKYNIYGTVAIKGGTYTDETAKGFANTYIADDYEMNANGEVVAK